MNLKHSKQAIIITLVSFIGYLILKEYFGPIKETLDSFTHNGLLSYTMTYVLIGIPIFIGTYLIHPKTNVLKSLGLFHNLFKSFIIALLFALPMFLGGLFYFQFSQEISIPNMVAGSIVIGFIEEVFFRGFLFGQIYKYTRFGFISAIVIGAILFAMGHLYQSQNMFELIGVFSVTFMGAVLFAWLYVEWNFNLWIPIFLHALMNLAWYIFEMDDTALGGILPNVFRTMTIMIAIVFTIVYKKKKQKKIIITKDTLIRKPILDKR